MEDYKSLNHNLWIQIVGEDQLNILELDKYLDFIKTALESEVLFTNDDYTVRRYYTFV